MSEVSDLEKAVDEFAKAMKSRLRLKARQGWKGWRDMGHEQLGERMLMNAVHGAMTGDQQDLVDMANLGMMIHRASAKPKDQP